MLRMVFGSLLCPSFIWIDEQRKKKSIQMIKKTLSFQPSRLVCCVQTHLVIGITWQQQEISFTKQKVFQRPFSQVRATSLTKLGTIPNVYKITVFNTYRHILCFFSWAFSLFELHLSSLPFSQVACQHTFVFYFKQSMTTIKKMIHQFPLTKNKLKKNVQTLHA